MGRHTFESCPRVSTFSCPIPLQSPGRYRDGAQPPFPCLAHIPVHNACQLPTPLKPMRDYSHGHDQTGYLHHTAPSKAQPAWITVLTTHTILPLIPLPLPVAVSPEVPPPLTLPAELPQQGSQATWILQLASHGRPQQPTTDHLESWHTCHHFVSQQLFHPHTASICTGPPSSLPSVSKSTNAGTPAMAKQAIRTQLINTYSWTVHACIEGKEVQVGMAFTCVPSTSLTCVGCQSSVPSSPLSPQPQ